MEKLKSIFSKKTVSNAQAENHREKTAAEHHEELTGVQKYLYEFEQTRINKDPDTMEWALREAKNHCKQANSLCLDEIFCPECPFGGLTVVSGRAGL